jgi:peptidoglycan/LPS O-acetylase OafA/YrhL
MRARRSEIRSLTGLRGVAALLVVLLHLKNISEPVRFWEVFIEHGYLWVDLFLALSGFILMRSYFLSYGDRTSVSFVAHFLLRRIGRIWPLFVVMACFALVTRQSGLTWFAGPFDNWQLMLFFNLLMVQAWFDYPSIDLPARS